MRMFRGSQWKYNYGQLISWTDFSRERTFGGFNPFAFSRIRAVRNLSEYSPHTHRFSRHFLIFLFLRPLYSRAAEIMPGIDEGGRPSRVTAGNPEMSRVFACLRRICVDFADILVPDMQSGSRPVSLLALENIVLSILLIYQRWAHATAFVDMFVDYMNQAHDFRRFGPNLEPFIVWICRAEIRLVVNKIFTMLQGTFLLVSRETLVLIFLSISDSDIRNELFDSWLLFLSPKWRPNSVWFFCFQFISVNVIAEWLVNLIYSQFRIIYLSAPRS